MINESEALYESDRHRQLRQGTAWDNDRVQQQVRILSGRLLGSYDHESHTWPAHGDDLQMSGLEAPLNGVWGGSSGALIGLEHIRANGSASVELPLADLSAIAHAHRAAPDLGADPPTLWGGTFGVRALEVCHDLADATEVLTEFNESLAAVDRADGFHGLAGSLRALHLLAGHAPSHALTTLGGELRQRLRDARDADGLWKVSFGERAFTLLGAVHGLCGNINALVASDPSTAQADVESALERLVDAGETRGVLATWAPALDPPPDAPRTVDFASGVAGILWSMAQWCDEYDLEPPAELFVGAEELIWLAGPCRGPLARGIAHGSAGLALALLAVGGERACRRARSLLADALDDATVSATLHPGLMTGDTGLLLVASAVAKNADPVVPGLTWAEP